MHIVIIFLNTTFACRNHFSSSWKSYPRGARTGITTPMPGAGAQKLLHVPLSSLSLLWFPESGKGVFHVVGRQRGSTEALPAFCQRAALSQLLRVRGITNRYTISMYYFFPSIELTGKQIRDSSHSPFSHLVIWTYDKARVMLPGVWLGFSVQVCPIRLDNISLYFPIAVRAIYIIPMCCWIAVCWRTTFFFLFIE